MAPKPKLSEQEVVAIRDRLTADPTLTRAALAKEYAVDPSVITRSLAALADAEKPSASADPDMAQIDHAAIILSPLNPRKTFDPVVLAELADSIAQPAGLLQNLVVRPNGDGPYILVAGERRWRAIGLLIDQGRWTGPVRCRVVEMTEAQHLATSLVENLHREDVAPLEEADAFAQLQALDPDTWTAQAIATQIGRTPRYVYQRLALAHNLHPDAKTLLTAGKLNVEGARLLAAESLDMQECVISQQWPNWSEPEGDIVELVIDEDDEPLSVAVVRGEIAYLKRRDEDRAAREAYEAELTKGFVCKNDVYSAQGLPLPDTAEDTPPGEAESRRLFEQAEREAAWKKRSEEAEERKLAAQAAYRAVAYKLPTDWPEGTEREGPEQACVDGCKFRKLLNYQSPVEFHVCLNPNSPRAGLLTHEDQGGRGCFENA